MMAKRKKKHQRPESAKISKLVSEGKPHDQAVAMALNMKREGRLTPSGGYVRKGGRKKKRSKRY